MLNVWCLIHAFNMFYNVRLKRVLCTLHVRCTFCCVGNAILIQILTKRQIMV